MTEVKGMGEWGRERGELLTLDTDTESQDEEFDLDKDGYSDGLAQVPLCFGEERNLW